MTLTRYTSPHGAAVTRELLVDDTPITDYHNDATEQVRHLQAEVAPLRRELAELSQRDTVADSFVAAWCVHRRRGLDPWDAIRHIQIEDILTAVVDDSHDRAYRAQIDHHLAALAKDPS